MHEQSVVALIRVVCVMKVLGVGSSGPTGGWLGKVSETRSMAYRNAVASVL
jgi:hypothetical protein